MPCKRHGLLTSQMVLEPAGGVRLYSCAYHVVYAVPLLLNAFDLIFDVCVQVERLQGTRPYISIRRVNKLPATSVGRIWVVTIIVHPTGG